MTQVIIKFIYIVAIGVAAGIKYMDSNVMFMVVTTLCLINCWVEDLRGEK